MVALWHPSLVDSSTPGLFQPASLKSPIVETGNRPWCSNPARLLPGVSTAAFVHWYKRSVLTLEYSYPPTDAPQQGLPFSRTGRVI